MHRKKQASALVAAISADNLSLYNCYIEVRLKKRFKIWFVYICRRLLRGKDIAVKVAGFVNIRLLNQH